MAMSVSFRKGILKCFAIKLQVFFENAVYAYKRRYGHRKLFTLYNSKDLTVQKCTEGKHSNNQSAEKYLNQGVWKYSF